MADPTRPANGADALISALKTLGVDTAYALPGVHNLPVWSAAGRSGLRLVGVRHEQTCAYAADGAARVSGRLGVALTTTGPGAANALAATGEARESSSPVLIVCTDIPAALRRPGVHRGVLHETRNQQAMFAPVTKSSFRADEADQIEPTVLAAGRSALEHPRGPVYLEIPTDLLRAPVASVGAREELPTEEPTVPDDEAFREADNLLRGAARPLVWVGGGAVAADARDAVAHLADRLGSPVIETFAGRGLMPPGHHLRVGLPPHVPEIGTLWDEADLVVAVGTGFDGMMTQNWAQPQPSCLISINVDPTEAEKNYHPDVTLVGDARQILERLAARMATGTERDRWLSRFDLARESGERRVRSEDENADQLLKTLRTATPRDSPVICDMCIPGYWVAAFLPFEKPRRLLYPMGWGTLGFAFPAAIGAALGCGSRALVICGDGGFLFSCGELATVAQERLPVTILLFDNGGYGMLRFDQRRADEPTDGSDLQTPDFVALAASFGIPAESVSSLGPPLAEALERASSRRGPSLIAAADPGITPPLTTSPRWYREDRHALESGHSSAQKA